MTTGHDTPHAAGGSSLGGVAALIVDAYSGPRGWSEGLRMLGLTDVGIELDPSACATAAAAGHRTIRADVARFPLGHLAGRVDGLIMSPPCQAFSTAGTGAGRDVIPELADAIGRGDWTWSHDDDRVRHVLEVGRWAETLHPTWIACEQVPPVLPLWRAYVDRWRHRYGWSCWAGILNAADYGVPQTRRRAFLVARTDGGVALPPAPTHCDGGALTLDGELRPWVSMAQALGWDAPVLALNPGRTNTQPNRRLYSANEPAPTVGFGHDAASWGWVLDRGQTHGGIHEVDQPSPVLGTRGGLWKLDRHPETYCSECATYDPRGDTPGPWHSEGCSMWENPEGRVLDRRQQTDGQPVRLVDCDTEPAPTLTGIAGAKSQWVFHRPATTLVGDGRAFGPHSGSAGQPQSTDTIRLTVRDALVLQGFPPDYPVQGTRTKQFEQIGNAVPPPLAAAVIGALTGARYAEAAA